MDQRICKQKSHEYEMMMNQSEIIHKHHEHDEHCHCNSHNHKHHHEHENCCCGHAHHHDDGCGCGCGHDHHNKKGNIILIIRFFISLVFLIVAFFIKNDIASKILLAISYIIISYDILLRAFMNIIKGKIFDENFLMTLASLTALIVYFINDEAGIDGFDGVLVILLYQIGEFFQHYAADKSKDSISKMLDLDIQEVSKIVDEQIILININDVKKDDILLIKPGDIIPVDGVVIKGNSSLNTSSLTGESKPLFVNENENDIVLSGCINNEGIIYIKATSTVDNSTTAKVKKLIENASKNKAKGEKYITKFAKIYTPIVILISLLVAFVIPLFLGFDEYFIEYLYKGLSIMVISCPCALVISIPLSYFMGIGKSAKNSILVKGASYLEELSYISAIAFDKTGTITKGNFKVSKVVADDEKLLKELLLALETHNTHPIATSIVSYLIDNTNKIDVENVINIPGKGISADYLTKKVLVGNEKLFKENGIDVNNNEIGTVVYVSYDNKLLGYVLIEDEVKEDAKDSLDKLAKKYKLYLISGDSKEIVSKVSKEVNIDNYYYETLPEDKVTIINNIKESDSVAYVGDGINDAASLLSANVSIAMKSLGSDIALNASDIVLMDDKISSINKALSISKKTMKIVKENVIASILLKVIVMVLAMIIKVPMFVAIIADVGVCLLCIFNSLRIMYGKNKY